jgi:iron complex outermembrane receptor protein
VRPRRAARLYRNCLSLHLFWHRDEQSADNLLQPTISRSSWRTLDSSPMNVLKSSLALAALALLQTSGLAQATNELSGGSAVTNETRQLSEMVVNGQGRPVAGNVVDQTTLKLPRTLHETPRSVSVIDSERIREQNFRTPVDTFYYTPGVFANSTASGGYHFISRGFRMSPDETRIDGFSGFYVGGGQSPQMLYGVDRVVVQRGPASLLYGAATLPGGFINIITEKPAEIPVTRLDLTTATYAGNDVEFGDRGTFGLELDSTGPITKDGRVLYRGIIAGDNSDLYTDDVLNQTRYFNTALTFKIDPAGQHTFSPLVQYSDNKRPAGAAMVISPSASLSVNDGITGPIHTSDLSPLDVNLYEGGRQDTMLVAGFDFHSQPAHPWNINAGYRFISYETDINQWAPQVNTAAQRAQLENSNTVSRTQAKSEADRYSHNFDVNATYEFLPTDWWKNLVQAGLNGRQYHSEARTATGPLGVPQSPLNIYTGAAPPVTDVSTGWAPIALDIDFYWNAYLQDQAGFLDEKFVLTVGLGYGQQHFNDAPTRESDVTPNASLLFNATDQLALYFSYATSYLPADSTLENYAGESGAFDPQSGVSYEVGAKYDLLSNRASLAVALFHTERDNVIVQDTSLGPVNTNGQPYYIQQEGQRARGVEFSGEYRILKNWNVIGTFAWIDASYDTGLFPEPVAKTPEFSWSLFTRYEITRGPLKRLAANLGVVWQDDRMSGNAARTATSPDPLTLPDFYRVDAGLSYRINQHADVALNILNVLDEKIFVDGTTGANLQIAAPRTLTLRFGYQF